MIKTKILVVIVKMIERPMVQSVILSADCCERIILLPMCRVVVKLGML